MIDDETDFNKFLATDEDLAEITPEEIVAENIDILPAKLEENNLSSKISDGSDIPHSESLEKDFEYIRNTLTDVTEKSKGALEKLLEIAESSQHPRAFEVVSLLAHTIITAQKDLMTIHREKFKIHKDTAKMEADNICREKDNPKVVNNTLYIGTTAQLDEFVAKLAKGKK
jgi:hypothetical protein